ncbi:hypothetical protein GCM10011297_19660 [Bacterioplanes sanyensis]|uniref:hypothetical protein n=1 Tax=Bacterioplanes sanyensis TaxID=1249553 RepID=UPI00167C409A|nr:hypothetical protein [Bacterioplanes sanyensis]GGY46846.1 hypothetical protein GCM10011297_19660 [Bacterioplanes sanyensis]
MNKLCFLWLLLSGVVMAQPQLAVKQQRFAMTDDSSELTQFLQSQTQLKKFSIVLAPAQGKMPTTVIQKLKAMGVTDEQMQVRHDLAAQLIKDEQHRLVALVEWFEPQQLHCQQQLGCANRSNLLQMLDQPRHAFHGDALARGQHGRDAVRALEYQREQRDLPGDRRTNLTLEGR